MKNLTAIKMASEIIQHNTFLPMDPYSNTVYVDSVIDPIATQLGTLSQGTNGTTIYQLYIHDFDEETKEALREFFNKTELAKDNRASFGEMDSIALCWENVESNTPGPTEPKEPKEVYKTFQIIFEQRVLKDS